MKKSYSNSSAVIALGALVIATSSCSRISSSINLDSGMDLARMRGTQDSAASGKLSISSPAQNANVSGTFNVVGSAPGMKNVEVSGASGTLLARVTPSLSGSFTASIDSSKLGLGSQTLTIDAWDAPAGQAFNHSDEKKLTVNVQQSPSGGNTSSGGSTVGSTGGTTQPSYILSISSPAQSATVNGTFQVKGTAPGFLNVEIYDASGNRLAQVTPSASGAFTASVDSTKLASGSQTLTIDAWDSAPGQAFNHTDEKKLTVNVQNANSGGSSSGGSSSGGSSSGGSSGGSTGGGSTSSGLGGFMVGQHFHQAQNPIMHKYMFARTHDNTAVSDGKMKWWTGDGQYDFSALDAFRDQHKANGAKILITFFGSPQWASARPNEGNYKYPAWTGGLAEPKDLNSYGRMVQATVSRYKSDLYAVECWNEPFMDTYNGYQPDNQHSEFFTGSPTALADMCKALSQNTKAVSPSTPVICPAEAYSSPIVVNAKTSQGESILNYCDAIGWHPYGYTGVAGVGGDLAGYIDQINQWTAAAGHSKMPIVITEWGVDYYGNVASQFQSMSSSSKANVLYQTLSVAYQKGVKGFAFYSYDDGYCGINGSDATTAAGITRGVQDFGGK